MLLPQGLSPAQISPVKREAASEAIPGPPASASPPKLRTSALARLAQLTRRGSTKECKDATGETLDAQSGLAKICAARRASTVSLKQEPPQDDKWQVRDIGPTDEEPLEENKHESQDEQCVVSRNRSVVSNASSAPTVFDAKYYTPEMIARRARLRWDSKIRCV